MDLNTLWFLLISVLFAGFFFLEGFDFGAGGLMVFLGKNDVERRLITNSFGPFWDGNEVWLLTAGGAIFAAFPHWYATMFSGFYLALFFILLAMILRIAGLEFRSKSENETWRKVWDWTISVTSLLLALLWGVAVTNLVTGVPIGADMEYAGTFFNLLGPFDLIGGIVTLTLFSYHGALFIGLRTANPLLTERSRKAALYLFAVCLAFLLLWLSLAFLMSNLFSGPLAVALMGLAAVSLLFSFFMTVKRRNGPAFAGAGLAIVSFTFSVFAGIYPNVMISSLNPEWSLTVYNASSSPYTLKLMTIVAVTLVPIVLAYQIWGYWVFRKRLTKKDLEY